MTSVKVKGTKITSKLEFARSVFGPDAVDRLVAALPDQDLLYQLAGRVRRDGIFGMPMTFPVVPPDASRLRLIVTAAHRREHLDRATESLARHARELGIIRAS